MSRAPWLTLAVAGAAIAVAAVPGASDAVALFRGDAPWRWWASHLGHFSASHLGLSLIHI